MSNNSNLALANTENDFAVNIVPLNSTSPVICPSPPNHWFIGVIVLSCILAILMIILCIYLLKKGKEKARRPASMTESMQRTTESGNTPPRRPAEVDGRSHRVSNASELSGRILFGSISHISSRLGRKDSPASATFPHEQQLTQSIFTDPSAKVNLPVELHSPTEIGQS